MAKQTKQMYEGCDLIRRKFYSLRRHAVSASKITALCERYAKVRMISFEGIRDHRWIDERFTSGFIVRDILGFHDSIDHFIMAV